MEPISPTQTASSKNALTSFQDGVESYTKATAKTAFQNIRHDLRESKRTGNRPKMAWSLVRMAMILRGQREYAAAMPLLEKARAIFLELKDHLGNGVVFQEMAFDNRELDRNALALEYAHQAIKIFQELERTLELAWAYDNMSVIQANLFHRHESLMFAKKARAIFLEFNSQNALAWNACNLANLYLEMGFYPQAETYYAEANKIFNQSKINQGIGWSLLGLATVHRAQCRFESATDYLNKAKLVFKELELKDRLGWCLLNEAAINRAYGKGEDAILINKRAIQLFGPLRNHDGVAWALFQIGQIYRDRGQLIKAWQTHRESLNLHTDISNRKGIGWAEDESGRTYLELNDLSHARECFVKAKVIAEHLDDGPLKAEVNKNLARLHLDEGFLQKSVDVINECGALCQKIQAREVEVEMYLERARYSLIIGEFGHAREWIRSADTLVQAHGLLRLKTSVALFLAEVLVAEGKIKSAVALLGDVLKLSEQLQQRRQHAEALLGLAQLMFRDRTPAQLGAMLFQVEKDLRVLSSRKIKAKFFVVKGMINFILNGANEHKDFAQALQILESSGLVVLQRQVLGMLSEMYRNAGREKEQAAHEADIKALLEKGPVDLHLVGQKNPAFQPIPVSLNV